MEAKGEIEVDLFCRRRPSSTHFSSSRRQIDTDEGLKKPKKTSQHCGNLEDRRKREPESKETHPRTSHHFVGVTNLSLPLWHSSNEGANIFWKQDDTRRRSHILERSSGVCVFLASEESEEGSGVIQRVVELPSHAFGRLGELLVGDSVGM